LVNLAQNDEAELSDGVINGSLSEHSSHRINEVMKEEQDDFAYDNMDKGSLKSFHSDNGDD